MFTISRLIEIDAAHRVMTHGSKCRGLHGHRYKIEAVCGSKSGDLVKKGEEDVLSSKDVAKQVGENGFCALKAEPTSTKVYVIAGQPTAEVLARHWHDVLSPRVEKRSQGAARLSLIRVYETPNSVAEYIPEEM